MSVDYSKLSNFDGTNTGIHMIQFGAGSDFLEVEMNELQMLQENALRLHLLSDKGEGLYYLNNPTYSGGTFSISDDYAIVDGRIFILHNVSIVVSTGQTVYLKTWEIEVDENTALKLNGNQNSGSSVNNYIVDSRYGKAVTKRKAFVYTLSLTNSDAELPDAKYLKLCAISGTDMIEKCTDLSKASGLSMNKSTISIATSSWVANGPYYTEWTYRTSLAITGVTTIDRVDLMLNPDSVVAAQKAQVAPFTETYAGGVYLYSRAVPSIALTGEAYVTKGEE